MAEPTTTETPQKITSEAEARYEKTERMLEISHLIDQADRAKIPLSELKSIDIKDIIRRHGPVSVKDWMHAVLYGKDGYYSSGRAKINSGDFITAVRYLPDVSAFTQDIFRNLKTQTTQPVVLSVASGGGEFDRNFKAIMRQDLPEQDYRLVSLDYSHELLKQQKEKTSDIAYRRVSASATEIPMPSSSVDVVFSNELHDAFPSRGFLIGKNDRFSELLIGLDDQEKFQPVYQRLSDSGIDRLKRELIHHRLDQIRATQDDLSYGFITWNPGSLEFLKESARVLKPGGIGLHADYVQRTGKSFDGPGYDDDLRFQNVVNWDSFVRRDVSKYEAPYLDVTVNMDPNFLKWAATGYGLEVISDEPHEEFVQSRATRVPNRRRFDMSFHVLTFRRH